MSINNIPKESAIEQYLLKLNFPFFFSKPVVRHMVDFIKGSVQKGYKGTVTDIVQLSLANCHRTTPYSRKVVTKYTIYGKLVI
jgi:hypothetical protein